MNRNAYAFNWHKHKNLCPNSPFEYNKRNPYSLKFIHFDFKRCYQLALIIMKQNNDWRMDGGMVGRSRGATAKIGGENVKAELIIYCSGKVETQWKVLYVCM